MKVRWRKVAAGIYETDTGRWRIVKDGHTWYIYDTKDRCEAYLWAGSLREAKQLVDDQIDSEATNV